MLKTDEPVTAKTFLRQTVVTDPSILFSLYADFLLRSSDARSIPISLDRIRSTFNFQRYAAPMQGRGFLLDTAIFLNSDDNVSVQRFTEAHEMMEALYIAIQNETPSRLSPNNQRLFPKDKEQHCERGAAELLMPAESFFPLVADRGTSLETARALTALFNTSLTATVRRMLDACINPCIFLLLKEGHKKNQQVPSKSGQSVLWGQPADWDPPAELRVWRQWKTANTTDIVHFNESVSHDTLIYWTLHARNAGQISTGNDTLDLEHIKRTCFTESMLVSMDHEPVVMALIHL